MLGMRVSAQMPSRALGHRHACYRQQGRPWGASRFPVGSLTGITRATSGAQTLPDAPVPAGCSRYTVSLKKPLGFVLEENTKTGIITVAEIKPSGAVAKDGQIRLGDTLIATSGVTYAMEEEYGEVTVKKMLTMVRMRAQDEGLKNISLAIGSHPGHIAVTLELQRCDTASA